MQRDQHGKTRTAGRQGVLGGVQGAESLFLWRAIGGAVLTLVPATAYSLKVGRALRELCPYSPGSHAQDWCTCTSLVYVHKSGVHAQGSRF